MPQRWGIWFAVQGDLRFLSHHDMMRATERTAIRAGLPLRYSQGFNPRPILSLVCPRPVGVATRDDLLALCLQEPLGERAVLAGLNGHAPRGLTFVRAGTLADRRTPRPRRADYELPLGPRRADEARSRLDGLAGRDTWPVERLVSAGRRRDPMERQSIDLRPLVAHVACGPETLRWTLVPAGDQWARPGELLELLGLDPRVDLADVVRTAVEYEPTPQVPPGADAPEAPASAGP